MKYEKRALPQKEEKILFSIIFMNTLLVFHGLLLLFGGDLRDYDNLKEIKEWVNGIYDAFDDYDGILFIRQGIVTCYVDNGSKIEQITIPYHCD